MYTAEYYKHKNIVDEDLEVESSVNIPPLSRIHFKNGFVFEANEKRTEVRIEINIDQSKSARSKRLQELADYARKLAGEISYLPCRAIGINFKHYVEAESINDLTSGLPKDANTESLTFTVRHKNVRTKITLNTGVRKTDGAKIVVFDSNHHKELVDLNDSESQQRELDGMIGNFNKLLARSEEIIYDTKL